MLMMLVFVLLPLAYGQGSDYNSQPLTNFAQQNSVVPTSAPLPTPPNVTSEQPSQIPTTTTAQPQTSYGSAPQQQQPQTSSTQISSGVGPSVSQPRPSVPEQVTGEVPTNQKNTTMGGCNTNHQQQHLTPSTPQVNISESPNVTATGTIGEMNARHHHYHHHHMKEPHVTSRMNPSMSQSYVAMQGQPQMPEQPQMQNPQTQGQLQYPMPVNSKRSIEEEADWYKDNEKYHHYYRHYDDYDHYYRHYDDYDHGYHHHYYRGD
jgi:hypothetical protein